MHFKMQVVARCLAGDSYVANELALFYRCANRGRGCTHVGIQGLCAVRMIDDHVISEAAVPTSTGKRDDDFAGCGRVYRRAALSCDINAIVAVQSLATA